jgi:hypothetical protein
MILTRTLTRMTYLQQNDKEKTMTTESKQIYALMSKVMAHVQPISKDGSNINQGYAFRSINAIYSGVRKALVEAGVVYRPVLRKKEHSERPRLDDKGKEIGVWVSVDVEVEYIFSAPDGSEVSACVPGEGMDTGDKATKKAMTSAVKTMLEQVFNIETGEASDSEHETPEPTRKAPKKLCPQCGAVSVIPNQYGSGYYCLSCRCKMEAIDKTNRQEVTA